MERGIKFWEKRRSSQDIVGRLADVRCCEDARSLEDSWLLFFPLR